MYLIVDDDGIDGDGDGFVDGEDDGEDWLS